MNEISIRKRMRRRNGVLRISKNYYLFWRDAEGREQSLNLNVPEKVSAQQKALDILRKRNRQDAGLEPTDDEVSTAQKAIADHIAHYLTYLSERKRNPVYQADSKRDLEQGTAACGFRRLLDIKPEPLVRWLQGQSHLSDRSLINKVKHWQMLTSWAVKQNYLSKNPLLALTAPRGQGVKHPRRSLTFDELTRLCAVAPPERALSYKISFGLGARRNEIKHLRWRHFHLDAATPRLAIPAEIAKNRKFEPTTIHPEFADELRELAGKPDEKVVRAVPMVETLKKDLKAAGIPYRDEHGRYVDFHAFRGTFITLMQENGATPYQAQLSARHSSARMTEGYTDISLLEKPAAQFKPYVPLLKNTEKGGGTAKGTAKMTAEGQKVAQDVAPTQKPSPLPIPVNIGLGRVFPQNVAECEGVGRTGFEPVKA